MGKKLFITLNFVISLNLLTLAIFLLVYKLIEIDNPQTDSLEIFMLVWILLPLCIIPLKLSAFVILSSICINCKFLDGFFESFEADSNFRNKVLLGALGLDLLCFLPLLFYEWTQGHYGDKGLESALLLWLWCGGGVLICYLSLFVWNKIIALLEKI